MNSISLSYIFFLLLIGHLLTGQQRYDVLCYASSDQKEIPNPFDIKSPADSISIIKKITDKINEWRISGYLFANADSVVWKQKTCSIFVYKGQKFKFSIPQMDAETKMIIAHSGIENQIARADAGALENNLKNILRYLNQHGYPFARIRFRNVTIKESEVEAQLEIVKGELIRFGELNYTGRVKLNPAYLSGYLGIKKGDLYNHDLVINLKRQIANIPFIQLDSFNGLKFIQQEAIPELFLSSKKNNYFDFILGVQPTTASGARRFQINGELNADLYNILNQGENFKLRFKRLSFEDQELLLSGDYPYIAGLPIGATGLFSLKRNFNSSVDALSQLGIQYLFTGNNLLKAYWTNTSSRLAEIDSLGLLSSRKLPTFLDYNFTGIGLQSILRDLDYRFNPRQGIEINININAGLKTIIENPTIIGLSNEIVDFASAYDTLPNQPFQFEVATEINYYHKINGWSVVKLGNKTGYKNIAGVVLQNEVFRLGGNRTLRGFDELSVFTDAYTLFTTEFRIMLDKNSYLSLPFADVFRGRTFPDKKIKTGIGVGMGINFSTAAGIFNLSFAAGNNFSGSPDFGTTKLHFGYVNLF